MKAIITLKNDNQIIYKDVSFIKYCKNQTEGYIYIAFKINNIEEARKMYFEDIKNIELKEFEE